MFGLAEAVAFAEAMGFGFQRAVPGRAATFGFAMDRDDATVLGPRSRLRLRHQPYLALVRLALVRLVRARRLAPVARLAVVADRRAPLPVAASRRRPRRGPDLGRRPRLLAVVADRTALSDFAGVVPGFAAVRDFRRGPQLRGRAGLRDGPGFAAVRDFAMVLGFAAARDFAVVLAAFRDFAVVFGCGRGPGLRRRLRLGR